MTSIRKRGKVTEGDLDDGAEVKEKDDNEIYSIEKRVLSDDLNIWRHLIPESVLGYIWWSVFFSLASTIWFFPMNMLEISGYEGFAVLLLSPIFTLIPFVDRCISSRYGVILMQALTVFAVLCYHAPTAFSRLLITSVGNFFAMLWLCGVWWFKSKTYRDIAFGGMTVGLILKLVLRIAFVTLNPLWSSSSTNIMIFIIAITCAIDRATFIIQLDGKDNSLENKSTNPSAPFSSWIIIALGIGAWFFMVQWLFGEVSVISRYTGTGFPSWSVLPIPGGILVLAAMVLGFNLSGQTYITSSLWWLFGCLSSLFLFHAPPLIAFAGGLGLAIYIMSVFPTLVNLINKCEKGKALTVGLLFAVLLLLASVWVVAYNFVPGGTLTREKNDIIMIISMVVIGFSSAIKLEPTDVVDRHVEEKEKLFGEKRKSIFRHGVMPALYILLLVGVVFMTGRFYQRAVNRTNAKLQIKDPKTFTSMIWTVHFGYDNKGWHSFRRSVQLMKDAEADVIGILESDCSRPYVGSTDFVSYIEEKLGFYADYGPRTKDHTWGAAIISRYPIIKSKHYLLPSPEGELAPALLATVSIADQHIDFVVVHMGNDRDDLDRKLQAEELSKIMDESKNPLVFLGYVTSAPGSRDHIQLMDSGRTKDIDYEDYERWCEYILYRDLIRLGYARVSHAGLSDTEVQLGKFRVPNDVKNYTDYNIITTTQEDVEEKMRFSDKFGDFHIGDFYGEGHHFHMATPKYFLPLPEA